MNAFNPKEYKVLALRECPVPDEMLICDTPQKAADYWRLHIATNPYFSPDCECFVVLLLNTRRRVKGHQLLTIGTMDTLLVDPRAVLRVERADGVELASKRHRVNGELCHKVPYLRTRTSTTARKSPPTWMGATSSTTAKRISTRR